MSVSKCAVGGRPRDTYVKSSPARRSVSEPTRFFLHNASLLVWWICCVGGVCFLAHFQNCPICKNPCLLSVKTQTQRTDNIKPLFSSPQAVFLRKYVPLESKPFGTARQWLRHFRVRLRIITYWRLETLSPGVIFCRGCVIFGGPGDKVPVVWGIEGV